MNFEEETSTDDNPRRKESSTTNTDANLQRLDELICMDRRA